MKTKSIVIMGSTGSIGTQAIEVCKRLNIRISAISGNKNISLLENQIRDVKPRICHVSDSEAGRDLRIRVRDTDTTVIYGESALTEFAAQKGADTLLNSIMGSKGLGPTMAAIESGKRIALANKETLVAAGAMVMERAHSANVSVLPVDSEHSAIFQCLMGNEQNQVKKIILTASGGPFFGKTRRELESVTPAEALKHPNWSMGRKITIDSATMMNKGLEILEARWLFGLKEIEVVVHPQSIVHSMVEFEDNSVMAQMGTPDMTLPIQLALTYPKRLPSAAAPLDFTQIERLTFYKPDREAFGLLELAYHALNEEGTVPLCLNSANEVCVQAYLDGIIGFLDIERIVSKIVYEHKKQELNSVEECIDMDRAIRELTLREVAGN